MARNAPWERFWDVLAAAEGILMRFCLPKMCPKPCVLRWCLAFSLFLYSFVFKMVVVRGLGGDLGGLESLFRASWELLGASWGCLGASWGRVWAVLGPLVGLLGPLFAPAKRLGGLLGPIFGAEAFFAVRRAKTI